MDTQAIAQILSFGGGIRMKPIGSTETMMQLASGARAAGVTLTIVGQLSLEAMQTIASAGRQHVIFDITGG